MTFKSNHTLVAGLIAFALGFMMAWLSPASVRSAPLPIITSQDLSHPVWTRQKCGETCTVKYSPGGEITEYLTQVQNLKRDKITLKIDGPCISACTIAVDAVRSNVCITPNASLQFHRGYEISQRLEEGVLVRRVKRVEIREYYSADILAWVDAHGGFPGKDMSPAENAALLVMPFAEAKKFFKVCK